MNFFKKLKQGVKDNNAFNYALQGIQQTFASPMNDLYRYQQAPPESRVQAPNAGYSDNAMDEWIRKMLGLPFRGPFINATSAGKLRGLLG